MPHKNSDERNAYLRSRYHRSVKGRASHDKAQQKYLRSEKGGELKRRNSDKHLIDRYGITREGWMAMLVAQSGRCACCLGAMRRPVVDHNHDTDAVRALVCQRCNLAIGWLEGNAHLLKSAERYLVEYDPKGRHLNG